MNKPTVGSMLSLVALGALSALQGCASDTTDGTSAALAARGAGDDSSGGAIVKQPPQRPPTTTPPSTAILGTAVAAPAPTAVIAEVPVVCAPAPTIFEMHPTVPAAGSGTVCKSDAQCAANEFCAPGPDSFSDGHCSSSGLLQRDGAVPQRDSIYYVAGNTLDIDLTLSACATVSDVLQGGVSLGGTGGFDDTGRQYDILSSTPTTWQGQDAVHVVVRIHLLSFGDGTSSGFEVRVSGPQPVLVAYAYNAAATNAVVGAPVSASFTVGRVAAVNGLMRATISETKMRSDFIVSMYKEFGDSDEVWQTNDDGSRDRTAHGLDWGELGAFAFNNQLYYTGTDLRIQSGQITFSMQFKGDAPVCDTDVNVDGSFTLVPASTGIKLQWLMGPRTRVNANTVCTLLTAGLDAIITDIVVSAKGIEDSIAKTVKLQVEGGAGADPSGFIPVCPTCNVRDVQIGNGRVDIYSMPGFDSVRVDVSTTRYTDTTKDPDGMGLVIPAGTYAIVAGGGAYDSCIAADGTSAATCAKLQLDANGTFNWWGSDVPVPTPWPVGPNGTQGYYAPRQHAWQRLVPLGVTRHVAQLPTSAFPAGALIARRNTSSLTTPTPRLRVQGGCMVPPDSATTRTKIAFGVNDVPSVGTEPPTRGRLEATVLIAPTADTSKTLFGQATPCTAAPVWSVVGDVTNVATVSIAN